MVTVAEPAAYKSISAVCGDAMDHDDALAYTNALGLLLHGREEQGRCDLQCL